MFGHAFGIEKEKQIGNDRQSVREKEKERKKERKKETRTRQNTDVQKKERRKKGDLRPMRLVLVFRHSTNPGSVRSIAFDSSPIRLRCSAAVGAVVQVAEGAGKERK